MPWIESHSVLLRHRKLTGLARDLRLKPVHALGHLHALWHAAIEQQEDGDLSDWSDGQIASAAQYDGDAVKFVSLLEQHRWLDASKTIHDWLDYAGMYLARKYSKRKDRLADIWRRHGRVYGERGKVDDKSCAANAQHSSTLQVGRCISFSEGNLIAGRGEVFNRQVHHELYEVVRRLIGMYVDKIQTSHRSTITPAETALGQAFLDNPDLKPETIEAAILAYSRECKDATASGRASPLRFVEQRRWESYANRPKAKVETPSERAKRTEANLPPEMRSA